MIAPTLAVLLVAALVLWVLLPAFSRRFPAPAYDSDEILESKHSVYRAILDLEHDHEMGKVESEDYVQLRYELESDAIGLITKADAAANFESAADLIEVEIAAARSKRRSR